MQRKILLTAIALAARVSLAEAQIITGTVMDSTSNTRVRAAQVMVTQVGSSQTALTDSTGRFRFELQPGMVTLRITALGYGDLQSGVLTLAKGERMAILALLSTQPMEIPPLYVLAKTRRPPTALEGFYQRRKRGGFGYFMDDKALARLAPIDVSHYLTRVPGAWVGPDLVQLRPSCNDAMYLLDGMPVVGDNTFTATELVNSMVSPAEIAAIEVYRGDVGVPMELMIAFSSARAGSCGLVAIWTKR
jgi:hypothetical protein